MRKPVNKKFLLLGVWVVLLGGLVFWINHGNGTPGEQPSPPPPTVDNAMLAKRWPDILSHAVSPALGKPDAPYTMVEFGDFECPPCGKTRPLLEKILSQEPGKVNLVFVNRPLPMSHHRAMSAAEAAQAAAAQGKFWPMYDQLYTHQNDLEPGFYKDYAAKAGLNPQEFEAALGSHQYMKQVQAAMSFADSLGIQTTPTVAVRDNATGKVTVVPYGHNGSGIKQFAANPPWKAGAKTADAAPPSPPHP